MKKQCFIISLIMSLFAANIYAQNTPIDEFLKKYPSRDNVTNVSVSQQMLQAMFPPAENNTTHFFYGDMKVPEAYSSVSISKAGDAPSIFADFKKILVNAKYEQYLEINKENSSALSYYFKKANNNNNEIVVLRQDKEQVSAIYIKGDINISQVDQYLSRIRSSLFRFGMTDQMSDHFFRDLNAFKPTIDQEAVQRYMTETNENFKHAMKEHKEQMDEAVKMQRKAMEQTIEFQRKEIDKSVKEQQKQVEKSIQEIEKEGH